MRNLDNINVVFNKKRKKKNLMRIKIKCEKIIPFVVIPEESDYPYNRKGEKSTYSKKPETNKINKADKFASNHSP